MEVKSWSNLQFLRTLLDAIPIPVFYKDINGIYLECNSAFAEKILGLPKEKIVGCSLYDFSEEIPKNLADIYHTQDLELIQKPGTQFYESQVNCADGVLRDFLFSKATVKDNVGNVAGVTGVMIDITTHKRAEQVMWESGNRYRELFENIRSGVAVYKAIENGNDFVFKEFNRAGEKIDNIKRKDIIGKRVTEAFPGVKISDYLKYSREFGERVNLNFIPKLFTKMSVPPVPGGKTGFTSCPITK
jgi:PAS domain S-box-containing protein